MEATEVDKAVKKFMKFSTELSNTHNVSSAARAMKTCAAQLVHKVKLNFKDGKHYHKMRVTIVLEGKQDQVDLIKWSAEQLSHIDNPWTTKFQIKVQ